MLFRSTEAQLEEADRIKLIAQNEKSKLNYEISNLRTKIQELEQTIKDGKDRVKICKIKKDLIGLKKESMRNEEKLFFEELKIDSEAEDKINELINNDTIKSKLYREFAVNVKGKADKIG